MKNIGDFLVEWGHRAPGEEKTGHVVVVLGATAPTVVHDTIEDAEKEAKRLVGTLPATVNQTALVMTITSAVTRMKQHVPPIEVVRLAATSPPPFMVGDGKKEFFIPSFSSVTISGDPNTFLVNKPASVGKSEAKPAPAPQFTEREKAALEEQAGRPIDWSNVKVTCTPEDNPPEQIAKGILTVNVDLPGSLDSKAPPTFTHAKTEGVTGYVAAASEAARSSGIVKIINPETGAISDLIYGFKIPDGWEPLTEKSVDAAATRLIAARKPAPKFKPGDRVWFPYGDGTRREYATVTRAEGSGYFLDTPCFVHAHLLSPDLRTVAGGGTLKLEYGRKGKTRDGEIVGPLFRSWFERWPFKGGGTTFNEFGFSSCCATPGDRNAEEMTSDIVELIEEGA